MQTFGDHLRRWRRERGLSQLALAGLAETSTRHLSFLESGRSTPAATMVRRLAEALGVAPAERDRALEAAGLSPDCRQAVPSAADTAVLDRAVAMLLDGHEPLPAIAVDANWRALAVNGGGRRVLALLAPTPTPAPAPARAPTSTSTSTSSSEGTAMPDRRTEGAVDAEPTLVDLLLADAGRGIIVNWHEVAALGVTRARAELVRRTAPDPAFVAGVERLAEELERPEGARGASPGHAVDGGGPIETAMVVPLRLRADGTTLSFVTMLAQFGGVDYLDVDAPRVELMFPVDEITRAWSLGGGTDAG